MRETTVLGRNELPQKTSIKLQTKTTTDALGYGFLSETRSCHSVWDPGHFSSSWGTQSSTSSAVLPGASTCSGLSWAARLCTRKALCAAGGKRSKLNVCALIAGFCHTRNPAELRQILSTLQKESCCDERRECVRQMGELRLKFRPNAIKTGKSALQLDTGLLCIQNFSLALSILTCV